MKPRKAFPWLLAVLAFALAGAVVLAQEAEVSKGSLEGKITDEKGSTLPGAVVTVTGVQGSQSARSGPNGVFHIPFLIPGRYEVKVEMPGFATIVVKDVEITLNRRTSLPLQLTAGKVQTVTVTAQAPLIDPKQTSIGVNVKIKDFINYLPIGRDYSDTFTVVPGVTSGGGTGAGNYSISGASGLENQYIIDGVNITNTGYGGIGSYNIVYGSLGTGVTTDFLEEIQVKTGGFEAEFGGATGGVLNTIVKSGGNDLAGSVSFHFTPRSLQSDSKTISLSTGAVSYVDEQKEDLGLTLSGPIIKDKLFYFIAYNPVRTKTRMQVEPAAFDSDFAPPGISTFPAASLGAQERERRNNNWAVKLSYYLTPNHRFEVTGFGDPSHGLSGPQNPAALRFLDYQQGGGQSEIRYGGNNYAVKYNAVFTPNFFGEFQVSRHDAKFRETPVVNENRVRDRRQQLCFLFPRLRCPAGVTADAGTTWFTGGTGYVSTANDINKTYAAKLTNVIAPLNLEVKYGVEYFDISYEDQQAYSGEPIDFFIPADQNGDGVLSVGEGVTVKSTSGAFIDNRSQPAPAIPEFRVTRNRFNPFPGPTSTKDLNGFIQATWNVTPRIIIKPGVRITHQKIEGSGTDYFLPFATSATTGKRTASNLSTCGASGTDVCESGFTPESYTFQTEWAPRIGATWDINGDGRSKLYGNLGRFYERIPNDLAVRSLSTEISTVRYRFRAVDPATNVPNTPDPAINPGSTILFNGLDPTTVLPGTRLPYKDEAILGYSYQIRPNLSIEARAIYRKQGRTLEDVQFATNESIQNLYYGVASGYYPYDPFGGSSGSPASSTFPALPFSAYHLSNPGDNTAGPIKDFLKENGLSSSLAFDFPKPKHKYKALELLLNKRLSDHWLLFANYRYSILRGNYEGLFRNDNGQSDPNITSLFDFPNSPTMRGQFQAGALNNDRPHVLNLYGAYVWNNGFQMGASFNWRSGIPRTPLLAHPNYQNAGEIPGRDPIYFWWDDTNGDGNADTLKKGPASDFFNDADSVMATPVLFNYTDCPRGCLGRTPDEAAFNLHFGYDWKIKDTNLDLGLDIFNVFNSQVALGFDDFVESTAGIPDPDFLKVQNTSLTLSDYQRPRSYRFLARWTF